MSNELEERLRAARSEFASPGREAEERAWRGALEGLTSARSSARLGRRGRIAPLRTLPLLLREGLRPRRAQMAALVAAAVSLLVLGALIGVLVWPGTTRAVASAPYPGPTFTPAEGWTTVATGSAEKSAGYAPLAWATNVPLHRDPGPFGVFPLGGSEIRDLPPDGILITAWLPAPELVPAPRNVKNMPYVDRELPLKLSDADVRPSWEGQPAPNIPEYLILARVKEQWLDVRVYFGTLHPSDRLLEAAQEQLNRLSIPDPA